MSINCSGLRVKYWVCGIAGNEAERSITVSVKTLVQGFTINGENAGDMSGIVSNAGDVNGDGLDDLIMH
jgi:hypothetical protein